MNTKTTRAEKDWEIYGTFVGGNVKFDQENYKLTEGHKKLRRLLQAVALRTELGDLGNVIYSGPEVAQGQDGVNQPERVFVVSPFSKKGGGSNVSLEDMKWTLQTTMGLKDVRSDVDSRGLGILIIPIDKNPDIQKKLAAAYVRDRMTEIISGVATGSIENQQELAASAAVKYLQLVGTGEREMQALFSDAIRAEKATMRE